MYYPESAEMRGAWLKRWLDVPWMGHPLSRLYELVWTFRKKETVRSKLVWSLVVNGDGIPGCQTLIRNSSNEAVFFGKFSVRRERESVRLSCLECGLRVHALCYAGKTVRPGLWKEYDEIDTWKISGNMKNYADNMKEYPYYIDSRS